MQASLEAEARGKAEALRSKKKLEQDINELEVALDGANRGRADSEKNIKKLQQQIHEIQQVTTRSLHYGWEIDQPTTSDTLKHTSLFTQLSDDPRAINQLK